MIVFLVAIALAAILVLLWRMVASDGYGTLSPPRSHRDVDDVDSWGMPTKHGMPR